MELARHFNKDSRDSSSEYLGLGPLRVSQIDFSPNNYRLRKRSHHNQHHHSHHPGHSVQIPFHKNHTQNTRLRLKTEPTNQVTSSSIKSKQAKISLANHFSEPQKVENNWRMKSFLIEKHLQQRAKQFVEKVSQQKSRIQGRLFLLKQQQLERKSLKESLEQCEHKLIQTYCRLQRKVEAELHVKRIQEKAQQRQSKSISKKKMKKRYIQCRNIKEKRSQAKKEAILPKQSIESNAFEGGVSMRRGKQPFHLSNECYLNEEERQVSLMKKMLFQLRSVMKRQQHLKANDSVLSLMK